MAKSSPKASEVMNNQTDDDQMESVLEFSSDISDAERPPILPVGEYHAEVSGVEIKHGKESGRKYLNVRFVVTPDNQPADFVEASGEQRNVALFFMLFGAEDTPQARFNMRKFCEAIGAPMGSRLDLKDFIGRNAKVEVEHQKDLQGLDQPRIRRVNAA